MKKNLVMFLVIGLLGCEKVEDNIDLEQPQIDKNLEKAQSEIRNYHEQQKEAAKATTKIDPKMDIVDLTICTATSMKIGEGIGVYQVWTEELNRRYKNIYPSKTDTEIDNYVSGRIDDKLRYLKDKGLETQQSFSKFYKENCKF